MYQYFNRCSNRCKIALVITRRQTEDEHFMSFDENRDLTGGPGNRWMHGMIGPTCQVFSIYFKLNLTCTSACTAICPRLIGPSSLGG